MIKTIHGLRFWRLAVSYMLLTPLMQACAAQNLQNNATFKERGLVGAGSANLTSPAQGTYVHGAELPDGRRARPAFLVGTVSRHDYDLFSDQEEAALWQLKHDALQPAPRPAKPRTRRLHVAASSAWPRVIVQGQRVCVPVLASATSDDWREHLTCWTKGRAPQ